MNKLLVLCIVCITVLAGCASAPNAKNAPAEPEMIAATEPAPVEAAPAEVKPAPVWVASPVVIAFAGTSTELAEDAAAVIDNVVKSTTEVKRVIITGYSNGKTSKRAGKIALDRARRVKEKLAAAGMKTANIRVVYVTSQAREAVKISWADRTAGKSSGR